MDGQKKHARAGDRDSHQLGDLRQLSIDQPAHDRDQRNIETRDEPGLGRRRKLQAGGLQDVSAEQEYAGERSPQQAGPGVGRAKFVAE